MHHSFSRLTSPSLMLSGRLKAPSSSSSDSWCGPAPPGCCPAQRNNVAPGFLASVTLQNGAYRQGLGKPTCRPRPARHIVLPCRWIWRSFRIAGCHLIGWRLRPATALQSCRAALLPHGCRRYERGVWCWLLLHRAAAHAACAGSGVALEAGCCMDCRACAKNKNRIIPQPVCTL